MSRAICPVTSCADPVHTRSKARVSGSRQAAKRFLIRPRRCADVSGSCLRPEHCNVENALSHALLTPGSALACRPLTVRPAFSLSNPRRGPQMSRAKTLHLRHAGGRALAGRISSRFTRMLQKRPQPPKQLERVIAPEVIASKTFGHIRHNSASGKLLAFPFTPSDASLHPIPAWPKSCTGLLPSRGPTPFSQSGRRADLPCSDPGARCHESPQRVRQVKVRATTRAGPCCISGAATIRSGQRSACMHPVNIRKKNRESGALPPPRKGVSTRFAARQAL